MIRVFPVLRIFLMSNILTDNITDLLKSVPGSNVIVTVGNSFRCDDGVGPYIGASLEWIKGLKVINAGINPENIIDEVVELKPKRIFIFDAADFGAKAGEVRLIPKESIPESTISTHSIPLNVITELIGSSIDTSIFFIGIQPKSVGMGEGLSDEVRSAADEIVEVIGQNCK